MRQPSKTALPFPCEHTSSASARCHSWRRLRPVTKAEKAKRGALDFRFGASLRIEAGLPLDDTIHSMSQQRLEAFTDAGIANLVSETREAKIFGEGIRRLRTERGWTQEDLADAARLTSTYVGQVERGDKVPSLTVVLKLARGLRVSPAELLAPFSASVMRSLRL